MTVRVLWGVMYATAANLVRIKGSVPPLVAENRMISRAAAFMVVASRKGAGADSLPFEAGTGALIDGEWHTDAPANKSKLWYASGSDKAQPVSVGGDGPLAMCKAAACLVCVPAPERARRRHPVVVGKRPAPERARRRHAKKRRVPAAGV